MKNDEPTSNSPGHPTSPRRTRPGTSAAWSTSIAAPASPRAGRRSSATWRKAPTRASPDCSKARRARPARRARGIRADLHGPGRRRHRLERCRPAQGLVVLSPALLARPAGRAAHAHVAQPLRDQQPEGQRPRGHEAPERPLPPAGPRALRNAARIRRARPGPARLARRAGQPQGTSQRKPGPRAPGAVQPGHRPLLRRRRAGRPRAP